VDKTLVEVLGQVGYVLGFAGYNLRLLQWLSSFSPPEPPIMGLKNSIILSFCPVENEDSRLPMLLSALSLYH